MSPPAPRPIVRLLVANRGEIAIRVLQAARELPSPPITYALYTEHDQTHLALGRPNHALQIPSPGSYMDISHLIDVVKQHSIDGVHPGYGFLSESAEFARRMWEEANAVVIGPGWEALEQTGDKLKAKALAEECGVPVLKAMKTGTNRVEDVRQFARSVRYPVMVKAIDGGGGRGIRLVEEDDGLQNAVERCLGESPSRTVFAEQAAVKGYKHIEVQVVADGRGGVKHLWERDCSVQRRFQKIVEVAPAPVSRRAVVAQAIEAAVRMARSIKYLGLGTWEFLVNVKERKFFFLEINPRLQVEHTITEGVTGVDLVREQLLLAQGMHNPEDIRLGEWWEASQPPLASSIQLRLCAEDPDSNFALSIGKLVDVQFPGGNGVRVDSHLSRGGAIGSDFDNLMAKIIVTASTWPNCVQKAQRALADTRVVGIRTNLSLLRAILTHQTFQSGAADSRWLEMNLQLLLKIGNEISQKIENSSSDLPQLSLASTQPVNASSSSVMLRKGNAWSLTLEESGVKSRGTPEAHHLSIDRVMRNAWPDALVADVSFTLPGSKPVSYKMNMRSTNASATATSSSHRRGDASNQLHIVLPMSGRLIDVLVDEGDEIGENEVIAYVKQMKMELEVRSPRAGKVGWVIELDDENGDDVGEGVLLVELQSQNEGAAQSALKSKL